MADQELHDFIERRLASNISKETLEKELRIQGYSDQEIGKALSEKGLNNTPAGVSDKPDIPSATTFAPATSAQLPSMVAVPVKMGKFKASRLIVKESWRVLRQNEELVWFPVISGIIVTMAVAIMAVLYYVVVLSSNISNFSSTSGPDMFVSYGTLFIYYLVIFFIANYFQAAMLVIIDARFHSQSAGFGDGIRGATRNIGKLFLWSLISATAGVILRIIEDRGKIFGAIIAYLLGAAWGILTYFSLPALIVGGASITQSFKDSAEAIRKTWGEAIIVNYGVGLFIGLLILLGLIIAAALSVLIETPVALMIIWGCFALFTAITCIVSTTLSIIFKLALFEYAKNGNVLGGFSPELIQGAIKRK